MEFRRLYGVQLEHVARKGIASLPDELFALIFKIAALSNGTGQAVLLSHVSRRFREVALGEHHLWATLHSGATRDELETFISRSGFNTDLHVVIHVAPRYFNPHAFISVCWPTAQRWKTLTISEADDLQPNNATALFILKTIDRSYDLRLPHLQELYIGHHRVHGARVDIRFRPSWTSPNLRALRCKDYIPSPSTSFASLSSIDLSLHLSSDIYGAQIEDLLSFLDSVPSVTDVNLQIHGIVVIEFVEAIQFEDIVCPSITSLTLHFGTSERRQQRPVHWNVHEGPLCSQPREVDIVCRFPLRRPDGSGPR